MLLRNVKIKDIINLKKRSNGLMKMENIFLSIWQMMRGIIVSNEN